MENFKKQLIRSCICYVLTAIVILVVWIIFVNPFRLPVPFSTKPKILLSTVTGEVFGVMCVLILYFITTMKAIKDPSILEKRYQKKQDERDKTIERDSCSAVIRIIMSLLIPASIFSAAFSSTVFLTLLGVMLVILITYILCLAYYTHKY